MKTKRHSGAWIITLIICLFSITANAGWQDILKEVTNKLEPSTAVSEDDIASALREALAVGTRNAVATVGRLDGFYADPDIKILLPPEVQQVESLLRRAGFGSQVDSFILSMNRAAETAAPQARAIFLDAASQITFADATTILNGRDDEATRYFQEKTSDPLTDLFTPIVHESMASAGMTRAYQDLDAAMQRIPFMSDRLRFDLDAYVTAQALDGIFVMVAKEEKLIRENPTARTTALLKKVFGTK